MSQKKAADPPKKRGRPPRNQQSAIVTRQEEGVEQSEMLEKQSKKREEGPFVFKSKYREDIVTLVSPRKIAYPDGTKFVDPGRFATFHRNTWTTHDPTEAQLLRDKIEERKDRDPLHIVETTL